MTATTITVIDRQIIDDINGFHRSCESAYGEALGYAFEAGRLLNEVKRQLQHGEWLPWLSDNFDGEERMAQRYMQVAENRAQLEAANPSGMSDLSLSAALKQITKPKPRGEEKPKPADVAGLLQGMSGPSREIAGRLDSARDRLRAERSDQQRRKHRRLDEMLIVARDLLDGLDTDELSAFAMAEGYRDIEIKLKNAVSLVGDLAFSFER